MSYYRGWTIFRSGVGSQRWVAERFGVTMRHINRDRLLDMIDYRTNL